MKECQDYIRKHGKILSGNAVALKSGNLPYGKVIHAVGPEWKMGNEGDDLYEAIFAALSDAKDLSSVAIPLISQGENKCPPDKCMESMMEAIADMYKDKDIRVEVHLVDPNPKNVDHMRDAVEKEFGPDKIEDLQKKVALPMASARTMTQTIPQDVKSTATGSKGAIFKPTTGSTGVITQEGIAINVVFGQMVDQTVDVIVNTTSNALDLSKGAVSQSILKAAGPVIQIECKENFPNGIDYGEVAETQPGNLKCKRLFHGACEQYSSNGEKILRTYVRKCLGNADAHNFTSIAFPAIGTGALGFPHDVTASCMFDEVTKYGQIHRNTNLKKVVFVIYDKDQKSKDAFQNEVQTLLSQKPAASATPTKKRKGRTLVVDSPEIETSTQRDDSFELIGRQTMPSQFISIGKVQVQVQQGDIVSETADAIVNSTNESLDLRRGAVAKAIAKQGGPTIQRECTKQVTGRKIKHGIAVTGAGNLPSKYIIHVIAPDYNGDWKKRIRECLATAEKCKCQSIALPALGTGIGADPAQMASIILDEIEHFALKSNPKLLTAIRITVFKSDMVDTFQRELQKRVSSVASSSSKGVFDRFKGWFSSYLGSGEAAGVDSDSYGLGDHDDQPQPRILPSLPATQSQLILLIYSENQRNIRKTKADIDEECRQEKQEVIINSTKDQDVIKLLKQTQIDYINSLSEKYPVKINVVQKKRSNKIHIEGTGQNIQMVQQEIYNVFRDIKDDIAAQENAELLAQQIKWMFDNDDDGYDEYPPEINRIIETASNRGAKHAEWPGLDDDGNKVMYKILFDEMVEIGSGDRVSVKRVKVGEGVSLPSTWSAMKDTEVVKHELVANTTKEYTDIEQRFLPSVSNSNAKIIKIERIQNPSLYQGYEVRKKDMEKVNPPGTQNERLLWHGTAGDVVDKINAQGFNRSYCGKNATALGKGVYFAQDASYSARGTYSPPDSSGHKHVYQATVLTGLHTPGNSSMIDCPPKDPNKPQFLYDSVTGGGSSPNAYVIFRDNQAYPEYLITFTM